MAYEYGVNLTLNTKKAMSDLEALLSKFKEVQESANKIKLNLKVTGLNGNDIEREKREFMRNINDQAKAQQQLATKKKLDAEQIAQAENRTATQRLQNEQKIAQAADRTATQRLQNEQKVQQAENKTATEAERNAMDILKLNEKVRQEKERTRQAEQKTAQEGQKTAQAEQKTERENIKTVEQKVELITKLFRLQQMMNRERENEANKARKVAEADKKAAEMAEKRAQAEAKAAAEMAKQARIAAQRDLAVQTASGYYGAGKTFSTMSSRYGAIGRGANIAGNVLNNLSQSMYYLQSSASQFMNNIWGYTQRIGSQILSSVTKIAENSFEQYKTLETAQIGFSNFFNGSPVEFTRQVRQEAEAMPGVSAADLIRSIQYIAPLAGGNSQLALGAAQGAMKAILYSGNDVSQYGTNALQNIMQLASGNFTYADIRQMLRAMPTLPSLLAETERGSELLDNGAITTEKFKAYIKKYGQQSILELFEEIGTKSPASDIYDRYRATFSGVIEETGEIIRNRWNDAMENSGLYRGLKDLIEKLDKNGTIEKIMNRIGDAIARVVNFFRHEDTGAQLEAWFNTIRTVVNSMKMVIGDVFKEIGKSLGIFNENGSLNTEGIRVLTRDLAEFVKGLVQGFGGGIKMVIGMVNNLKKTIGEDAFRKLGQAIAFLASPMGQLISLATKLSAGFMSLGGGLSTALSSVTGILGKLSTNAGSKVSSKIMTALNVKDTAVSAASAVASNPNVAGYLVERNPAGLLPAGQLASGGAVEAAKNATKINTLMSAGVWNNAKMAVAKGIGNLVQLAANLLRGGLIAGITVAGGKLINTFLDVTQIAGESTDKIKQAVSGVTAALAAFAFVMTVSHNPLIAALTGLVAGIVGYTLEVENQKIKLQQEKNQQMKEQVSEQTMKDLDSLTDYVIEVSKAAGMAIDTETEEGRTSKDNLRRWFENKIVKYDENGKIKSLNYGQFLDNAGNVDPAKIQEAFAMLSNDIYQQKMNSKMIEYVETEAFANAATKGSVIDLDKDVNARQRMYDLIVRNLLNGTDAAVGGVYDYKQSQEKVIRDYLGGEKLTTGMLESLEAQEQVFKNEIQPTTLTIKDKVEAIDNDKLPAINGNMEKVANATEGFKVLLTAISNNVMKIANKSGANFDTFGFNGAQLGSFNGLDVADAYSRWGAATNKGIKHNFSSLYVDGNEFVGGHSVERNAAGFKRLMEDLTQLTGNSMFQGQVGSEYEKNWKSLTTRERAAKAYGKDPNSNDDWTETYNKLMDAYNDLLLRQAAVTPGSSELKDLEGKVDTVNFWASQLAAFPAGDWVTLFWWQNQIEELAKSKGIKIDFRARGGAISSVFSGRGVDTVPAYLQPGEYVMRRSATSKAGLGVMDALNRGDLGAAARAIGSRFSNSWNNSRSYASTVNNNQKTVTNNVTVNNRSNGGRLNSYYSLANSLASSF